MTDNIHTKPNNYLIPMSILIVGGLVAGAVFLGLSKANNNVAATTETGQEIQEKPKGTTDNVRAVTADDHIKGNPNASVMIVEYSDFECPFCKKFHDTMNEIMEEAGRDGQVAWVYRQFPLDQLHPVKARAVAVASECAAELGGNESFWKFSDRYMELTLSNNKTEIETVIPQIVEEIGLNKADFQACFESGRHDERIDSDIENAVATGGRGTPWSIVIGPDGTTYPLSGAQPYEVVKQLIDIALNNQ